MNFTWHATNAPRQQRYDVSGSFRRRSAGIEQRRSDRPHRGRWNDLDSPASRGRGNLVEMHELHQPDRRVGGNDYQTAAPVENAGRKNLDEHIVNLAGDPARGMRHPLAIEKRRLRLRHAIS